MMNRNAWNAVILLVRDLKGVKNRLRGNNIWTTKARVPTYKSRKSKPATIQADEQVICEQAPEMKKYDQI